MVSEFHEVDTIALAVVCVDFLTSLQVVKTHTEVFTACDEVLAIVTDVYRVDLLLEVLEHKGGLERFNNVIV